MILNDDRSSFDIIRRTEVTSTQDVAKDLLYSGDVKHNFVVIADRQTHGRGRYDRLWQSEEGNFFCTVVIGVDNLPFGNIGLSPLFFALALQRAFTDIGVDVKIKWPNDMLCHDKKISGMLLEKVEKVDQSFILVGIGVNIQHFPVDVNYRATSLKAENVDIEISSFLDVLIQKIGLLLNENSSDQSLLDEWKKCAKGIGEEITVNLYNKTLKGQFKDLDLNGNLILITGSGEEIISAGDVFFEK